MCVCVCMCEVFDSESALELNPEAVTLTPGTTCISCNRSHKVRLCFAYRIKTERYIRHHITAAGYTARKFCYKAHCHLDVPVTGTLSRVNEASFLGLLNCVALLMYVEKTMKDLCCFSITISMRFRRLQTSSETAIHEVQKYIIG